MRQSVYIISENMLNRLQNNRKNRLKGASQNHRELRCRTCNVLIQKGDKVCTNWGGNNRTVIRHYDCAVSKHLLTSEIMGY